MEARWAVQRIERKQLWSGGLPPTHVDAVLSTRREGSSKLKQGMARITTRWGRVAGCLHNGEVGKVNWTEVTPPSRIEGAGPTTEETGEGPGWLGSKLPWKDVAVNLEFKRARATGRLGGSAKHAQERLAAWP